LSFSSSRPKLKWFFSFQFLSEITESDLLESEERKKEKNPGCIPGFIRVYFHVNNTGLQRLQKK